MFVKASEMEGGISFLDGRHAIGGGQIRGQESERERQRQTVRERETERVRSIQEGQWIEWTHAVDDVDHYSTIN
jgi:hypothetical protein